MSPTPVRDAKIWDWPLQAHDGLVKVHDGRSFFEVSLDAQEFTPEEIDVKVTGDEVVIHLKHEKRGGSTGSVAREFLRAYHLPQDTDMSSVKSHLSGGHLVISANKKRF